MQKSQCTYNILCYNLENTTPNGPVTYDLNTSTVHQTGNTENGKGFVVLYFMHFIKKTQTQ